MKKLGLTIFAVAILALPLCAQVSAVRADIPFEFVAGDTTVAPGQYDVRFLSGSVVQLAGKDSYYLIANPDDPYGRSIEPKLVFNRYGDQYFLSRIAVASTGRDFAPSRTERELTKTAAAARKEVVVAMR
jgi:hypothetical protein